MKRQNITQKIRREIKNISNTSLGLSKQAHSKSLREKYDQVSKKNSFFPTKTEIKNTIKSEISKTSYSPQLKSKMKVLAEKGAGVHSFKGKIKDSKYGYPNGLDGTFVQSVKGMEGKFYVEKSIQLTNIMFDEYFKNSSFMDV
jgi:hypothetical protein